MKKLAIVIGVLVVLGLLVLILIAVAGGSYNRLVKRSQAVDSQWAQVQNVYQRRADLIPNLVATVSGAANFEKSTLTEIVAARASVGQVKINPNSVERRDFNTAVQNYNTAVKSFPEVFYAGAFGFSVKPYFAAIAGTEMPPKVSFDFNKPAAATNP